MPRCIDCKYGERCVINDAEYCYVVYLCHATDEYIEEKVGDCKTLECEFYVEDSDDDFTAKCNQRIN